MPVRRDFYVYVWYRGDGTPCYVGKGHGNRWRSALKSHNRWLRRILSKDGDSARCFVTLSRFSEREALALERRLIHLIGRPPLVNYTDGGYGVSGLKHSAKNKRLVGILSRKRWQEKRDEIIAAQNLGRATADYRARRSEISRRVAAAPAWRRRHSRMARRRFRSPEERHKTSVMTKLAMARPEVQARVRAGHARSWLNPERHRKASEARRGFKHSEETKLKIGAAHLGMKRSAEARAKMSAWQIGRKMSAEARARMSAAAKRRFSNPAAREHLSHAGHLGAMSRWHGDKRLST